MGALQSEIKWLVLDIRRSEIRDRAVHRRSDHETEALTSNNIIHLL